MQSHKAIKKSHMQYKGDPATVPYFLKWNRRVVSKQWWYARDYLI